YTIRINTWRRPEQLVVSVKHHASCPGVKQIQIIWCDKENDPPKEIIDMMMMTTVNNSTNKKIVIERHVENTLNERFNIIEPVPTIGILSIDDDVLRPCEAIDSGFFKWVKSPHRMVGFDARNHVENEDGSWEYGTTKKENKYSLSLTRYCFIHRDYMTQYMSNLPKAILDTVENYFNCEDIAMTLMISSQTQGQPPLLADLWAMNSMIKLDVKAGISGGSSHKKNRDNCVDYFASLLG
ncbi:nucleotide-diphospho-sugar transferase, partial [Fragilariopsis cylindrus CCMP1102]